MRYIMIIAAMLFMLAAPGSAKAADSIVLTHTGLRAGPGTGYPLLLDMYRGQRITVLGCIRGWRWCEVVAGGLHGFAVGQRLGIDYYGRNVQVAIWGPKLGLPYVVFEEQPYWSHYYYDRDFYRARYGNGHWDHHEVIHCDHVDRWGKCEDVVHDHRHDDYDNHRWHHDDYDSHDYRGYQWQTDSHTHYNN